MRTLAIGGAAVSMLGAAIIFVYYDPDLTLPILGATLLVAGILSCCTAHLARWQRTFDDWFDAGYRVGYRAGKRDRSSGQVVQLNARRNRGLHSEAPIRTMASHRPAAGWHETNPN